MKVLFISTMAGAPWGGSEELWVKSASYALDKGHDVTISVFNWGDLHPKLTALQQKGAKVIQRRKIFFGSSISNRLKGFVIKKLFASGEISKLSKLNADVVIISQGTIYECMFPEFLAFTENKNTRLGVITQANTEYDTIPSECVSTGRFLFENAKHLFFVSKRNEVVAERQLAMYFNNSRVVSNPANLVGRNILAWNLSETLHFAYVGRINSAVKGLGVLIQILSDKKWVDRNWTLNFYGKGEDEQYLKNLVDLYNLENKIKFHGFVNDIAKVWEQNHALLMPSTLEGTPLSLIEAMLCGRTAVVSDVGGNAELIEDNLNGFVSEAPSVNSFGKAMERMWSKKSELQKLGEKAFVSVKEKINPDSHIDIVELMTKK